MTRASNFYAVSGLWRIASSVAIAAVICIAATNRSSAAEIALSLNVNFADPLDPNAGGTWQVVAKSDAFGVASVGFDIEGVNGNIIPRVPTGKVNGSATVNAGFEEFLAQPIATDKYWVVTGQVPVTTGAEFGLFYNVGVTPNGSPSGLSSLVTDAGDNVPWATGDLWQGNEWNSGFLVASGAFDQFEIPEIIDSERTVGQVFLTEGDATTLGDISSSDSTDISFIRRKSPDYNNDGIANAADYTLWRNTLGQMGTPGFGADGNVNGVIDRGDYLHWRDAYGYVAPTMGGGSVAVVPTPGSGVLLGISSVLALLARRRRRAEKTGESRFSEKLGLRGETA